MRKMEGNEGGRNEELVNSEMRKRARGENIKKAGGKEK
jgi:hypothetical protein